jgi:hypothetical protein
MTTLCRCSVAFAVLSGLVCAPSTFAQGVGILRPSQVAGSARTLTIKPTLAGFRLGEPEDGAVARLGGPLKVETLGSGPEAPVSYTNVAKGITLIASRADGVGIVLVTSRGAGVLDGIRVGDRKEDVVARWSVAGAGGDTDGLWLAGRYVVSVKFDRDGRVARLAIGFGL